MNLGQLQTQIQSLGYATDTLAAQAAGINATYREICGMRRWPFLEKQDNSLVTVTGTPNYSLASIADLLNIDAVRIDAAAFQQYVDLQNVEPQELRDLEHTDRDLSTPAYWTFINNELRFWPWPDGVYTIHIDYVKLVPDLVAPTDVPVLPAVYHDVLVWGAIINMGFRERDWLGRQFAEARYEKTLSRMEEEYALRQRQTSSHVKSSGFYDTRRSLPFSSGG